jgi:serine/threonine kinase 32
MRFQLLDRNPKTRMACQSRERGLAEFQKHPWFASLDWDKLLAKELPAPFVPDVSDCAACFLHCLMDYRQIKRVNFDVSHELDEFLMVEKPLTHSSRKKNVDFDKLKPEFREMEEQ